MIVKIIVNDRGNPPGKLADAELHFSGVDGPLTGLKLIGFGVWERRATKDYIGQAVEPERHFNVTFPQYSVNGKRRSFALLRPIGDSLDANHHIKEAIISAYVKAVQGQA